MSAPAMTEVATAVINLADQVPELLQLPKFGGGKGHGKRIITITPSADKRRLHCNAKRWMEDVMSAASASADESTAMDSYDIVSVLIRALLTFDPLVVNDIASMVPESSLTKVKLDPEVQQAMMHAANLGWSQLRTIKSHLCFANMDAFQPEPVIRALQVPFCEGKGNRKRVAWTVPCDDLLRFNANQCLNADSFSFDKLDKAHVILVGDHGQGALRLMVSLLLITRKDRRSQRRHGAVNECIGTELALEVDGLCGYVQCLKDAYEVMNDTVAGPINELLWRIKNAASVTIFRDLTDRDKDNNPKIKLCWGNAHTHADVLANANVELFVTGDLAFCAMILGKESMAPFWCWQCTLTKKQWTNNVDVQIGSESTVEGMRNHYNKLQSDELNKKKSNEVLGVTEPQLIDCVEPRNTPVPPLHNNELFVNHPINKGLMRWVHCRIEQLPIELVDAKLEEIDAVIELEKIAEELECVSQQLNFLQTEASGLKPKRKKLDGVMVNVFDDDDHKKDYEENQVVLGEAKDSVDQLNSLYQDYSKDRKAAARKVKRVSKKKECGALSQEIRQCVDQMLEEVYKILRSAYHGGDFEGNHCRKFMRHADQVMDSIEAILLAVPPEDRAADDNEIRKCCRAHKRLFQHFDLLIHCCQQPFGALTDADMIDVNKLVGLLDRLWRRLFHAAPPKAHAWWHLVDDLERFQGLKHHQESKIEVAHQVGRRIDLLFWAVNDIDKKIECLLRFQHTMEKPSMKLIQSKVKDVWSKKRRTRSNEDDGRDVNRHYGLLLLDEIVDAFPSLQELAVDDRKDAVAMEAAANNVDVNIDGNNTEAAS